MFPQEGWALEIPPAFPSCFPPPASPEGSSRAGQASVVGRLFPEVMGSQCFHSSSQLNDKRRNSPSRRWWRWRRWWWWRWRLVCGAASVGGKQGGAVYEFITGRAESRIVQAVCPLSLFPRVSLKMVSHKHTAATVLRLFCVLGCQSVLNLAESETSRHFKTCHSLSPSPTVAGRLAAASWICFPRLWQTGVPVGEREEGLLCTARVKLSRG